ncbi:GNAT family N-acetyltransferase [Mesorhizobium sp. AaZ16]|uniref:GNAT family N-acetyltransferase n=1 Tax=Mesorhizobium sp. AaZ16 TaxID=3402289 RepID=UPI00374EF98B
MPLRGEIITDGEAFEALAPHWWALWRNCTSATPFQTPAWLLPWWRHFSPGRLTVIAVWRHSRLVGLAPFYLEEIKTRRLLPIGIALSDYLDVLIEPGCEGEAGDLIFKRGMEIGWDSWEFEELHPGSQAAAICCPGKLANTTAIQNACPVIRLQGEDDLAGCVPARRRRQLRRARASAIRRGTLAIEPVSGDTDAFLAHLFRLHGARWAEREENGILDSKVVQDFHRDALAALSAFGLARCSLIRIGDDVASAYYGMSDGRRAYAYLGGFDPGFSEQSPGSILIGHAIAEAIREGVGEFHFLRGREAYKYSWGATDRWNQRRSFHGIEQP